MTYLLRVSLDIEEKHPGKSLRFLRAADTIKTISKKGDKVVILSHWGRPKNNDLKLSLKKFKRPLEKILSKQVTLLKVDNLKRAKQKIEISKKGSIFLLENLRFLKSETANSTRLSKSLAGLGDLYVNDDFATSHRKNASNVGITKFLPSKPGPNLLREVKALRGVSKAEKPFVLVIGGAKISDKLSVIKNLLHKVDFILLGGGPGNTFVKANGLNIGKSIFEPEMISEAKKLSRNSKIVMPVDALLSKNRILDIGPETIKNYAVILGGAKTIVWGGPMGFFENKKFATGTKSIWQSISKNKRARVIVGGGETLASLKLISKNNKVGKNVYLSTGGGAMLEFLSGKKLPALVALKIQR
jgi:phosphoglycerate kinase